MTTEQALKLLRATKLTDEPNWAGTKMTKRQAVETMLAALDSEVITEFDKQRGLNQHQLHSAIAANVRKVCGITEGT